MSSFVNQGETIDFFSLSNNYLLMSSGQISSTLYKADISFYRAYVSHRSDYRKSLVIHIIEIIMFAVIIPIDFKLLEVGDKMGGALIIGAADSLVSFIILAGIYYTLFSKQATQNYCSLARDIYHATNQAVESPQSIEECTSSTILYTASGVEVAGLNQQIIKAYSNLARQQIEQCIEYKYSKINWFTKAYNFLSLFSMLVIIVLLATSSSRNAAQISVLIVFLLLESYIKLKIMVIILLIALSPILCILFLCYVCCCKTKDGQAMMLDLKPKNAGVNEVVKSGGQCAICLMDIKINEAVYELKCSEKHIYHQGCLDKWSRVKPNCPTCRKDLPLIEAPEGA